MNDGCLPPVLLLGVADDVSVADDEGMVEEDESGVSLLRLGVAYNGTTFRPTIAIVLASINDCS